VNNSRKIIKFLCWIALLIASPIIVYSFWYLRLDSLDFTFLFLLVVTVFLSSTVQIQLPRTKIHLSFAEATIFFFLVVYGTEAAVIVAGLETLYASFTLRRKNISIKPQTIALNTAIGIITTFVAGISAGLFFDREKIVSNEPDIVSLILILTVIATVQFSLNSILVAGFTSLRSEKTFVQIFNENCFNALIMYAVSAFIAGLMVEATGKVNPVLLLVAAVIATLAYVTYRRYVDDVKETSAKAEQAERERAEQAEKHIEELQHHIIEQEKTEQALRESREKFRHAAYHDDLTDLPNRNKFIEILQFQIEKNQHHPESEFAVLFLDLNRFKTINDSLGHSMGDELILRVAKRLANLTGNADLVARFSGDEFAIILTKLDTKKDATEFAEMVHQKLALPFTISGRQIFTSVSIGIAFGNVLYKKAEEILRDADIAMYHSKESHKNYEIFDPSMHIRAVTLLQLETDLRHALERDEMLVYYQPIIDLATMMPMGFEALMRWKHPQRGIVPPIEFIPVAEETGLIIPLTIWIMRTACYQAVEWNKYAPEDKPLIMSINLSGKHFSQSDLVSQVRQIIDETGIDPHTIKLELTESAVMDNAETAIGMLKELRSLGVKLSIDDFGTGYSSLSYLHRFPIDMLKVDRSFVSTMEGGTENGEIVRTVIALAKTLRLSVIAEGIESIHQLHQLRILGCEYGQGYLFSRPVPPNEAVVLLQDKLRWKNIIPNNNPALLAQNREFTHLRLDN
jgi:diguanylate cyclase (GGDEF)-like protein